MCAPTEGEWLAVVRYAKQCKFLRIGLFRPECGHGPQTSPGETWKSQLVRHPQLEASES